MSLKKFGAIFGLIGFLSAAPTLAEERAYTEGTVWALTLIKINEGQLDNYAKQVIAGNKQLDDAAKKEGILLSVHYLSGEAANGQDFNFMILNEYKNMAAFDTMEERYDALLSKLNSSSEKIEQGNAKRAEIRTIVGNKLMRELLPK